MQHDALRLSRLRPVPDALLPENSIPMSEIFWQSDAWLAGDGAMKASQFTDAQKAFILKQGEQGIPVAEICRKAGISQATYFNWRVADWKSIEDRFPANKHAGLMPSESAAD